MVTLLCRAVGASVSFVSRIGVGGRGAGEPAAFIPFACAHDAARLEARITGATSTEHTREPISARYFVTRWARACAPSCLRRLRTLAVRGSAPWAGPRSGPCCVVPSGPGCSALVRRCVRVLRALGPTRIEMRQGAKGFRLRWSTPSAPCGTSVHGVVPGCAAWVHGARPCSTTCTDVHAHACRGHGGTPQARGQPYLHPSGIF